MLVKKCIPNTKVSITGIRKTEGLFHGNVYYGRNRPNP
jgi:hypothetical protein